MFQENEGPLDRALRIAGGVVLIWLGMFSGFLAGPLAVIAPIVGTVMLVTGFAGSCPLYTVLGFRTLPR